MADQLTTLGRRLKQALAASLWALIAIHTNTHAQAAQNRVFYILPTVEGLLACDQVASQTSIRSLAGAEHWCMERRLDGAPALARLLDTLEPGGARGQVQVGYIVTIQLLDLYRQKNGRWQLDDTRVDAYLRLIAGVDRPVLIYLALNHFDTQGPVTDAIVANPDNLMLSADGSLPVSRYFGYRTIPYTLQTSETLWVNQLRFDALRHTIRRIQALPPQVKRRIIGYTIAGEVHHFFPDFDSGMGRHENVQITDYSPAVIDGFRQWLLEQHDGLPNLNRTLGTRFARVEDIPVPRQDIRRTTLRHFMEHYDAFAAGYLPFAGWLWDPEKRMESLKLYINGKPMGSIETGFNRLDVYRAVPEVTDPNTGFRIDFDFNRLPPGRYHAQVVLDAAGQRHLVGSHDFTILSASQRLPLRLTPPRLRHLKSLSALKGIKGWLDLPGPTAATLYYNPLARAWDQYRSLQTEAFLHKVFSVAVEAGAPASLVFSHQILPRVNSSWNPGLFATDASIEPPHPWQAGINLYGGAVNGDWTKRYITRHRLAGYGVPEMHPQQWKQPQAALQALQLHRRLGAKFVSPYYFSVAPQRFKNAPEHGVNAMELRPENPRDGSDHFYQAIRAMAQD